MRRLTPLRFAGGVRPGTGNGPVEAWASIPHTYRHGPRLDQARGGLAATFCALARSGHTWRLSSMSAISNTREICPPGQTIAKPCPRRFTRRCAFISRARPVESMKSTLERSTTSGTSSCANASFSAAIMRGAVAMSSSPSTASSSYPSTRLRSTASEITALAIQCLLRLPRALRSPRATFRLSAALARDGRLSRRRRQPHLPRPRAVRRGGRGCGEGEEGASRRWRRAHGRAPGSAGGRARRRPVVRGPARHRGRPRPRRARPGEPLQAALTPGAGCARGQRRHALARHRGPVGPVRGADFEPEALARLVAGHLERSEPIVHARGLLDPAGSRQREHAALELHPLAEVVEPAPVELDTVTRFAKALEGP